MYCQSWRKLILLWHPTNTEIAMQTYKAAITPKSAFGTPLKGDTLFGQLCWAIHNRFGNARLIELLVDYTKGKPFVVTSDALPAGYFPRPVLPSNFF